MRVARHGVRAVCGSRLCGAVWRLTGFEVSISANALGSSANRVSVSLFATGISAMDTEMELS